MEKINCDNCGASNAPDNWLCVKCGAKIAHVQDFREVEEPIREHTYKIPHAADSKTCKKCGAMNERWNSFCLSCAAPLSDAQPLSSLRGIGSRIGSTHYGHGGHETARPMTDQPVSSDGIGEIISKSLALYSANWWLFLSTFWLVVILIGVASVIVDTIINYFAILSELLAGAISAIMVGIYVVYLTAIRGYRADIGLALSSLSGRYFHAAIAMTIVTLVQTGILYLTLGPAFDIFYLGQDIEPGTELELLETISSLGVWLYVGLILTALLNMFCSFALILIADLQVDFGRAIWSSARFVMANFWEVLWIIILAGLLSIVGIIVFIIGIIVTAPLQFVIFAAYYEARKELFEV